MDTKALLDEFKSTWELMKQAMDDKADKSTVNRMNDRLDELDTKMKAPALAGMRGPNYDPPKAPNKDLQLFLRSVARGGPQNLPDSRDRASAEAYISQIETKLNVNRETKGLLLGDDTLGGFLAPPELADSIVKGIRLQSPVRQYANVRETTRHELQMPTRSGVFSAQWTLEAATRPETTGLTYSMDTIPTFEMYALVMASWQVIEDSAFDLAAQITDEASEAFAVAEGTAFVVGDGQKKPEGFMVAPNVATDLSGSAGAITADSLITFVYNLKSGYAANATLFMNRKTLGVIRGFKDSQNRYLWEPNYQVGQPQTILGIPVAEMPDMDDIGATKFPVAIGNFRRGYQIVDRVTMSLVRLDQVFAQQGMVGFLFRKRVGGQVILPEAIRKLKSNNS